jgi:hypothetical protein
MTTPYSRTLLAALSLLLLPVALSAQTALTVYNQYFAVVREAVPLNLTKGINTVAFDQATLHVEPDSVVLRDPTGKVALRILQQSYRAETASQALLLSQYEGQELDFLVRDHENKEYTVRGKVIRSGYTPNFQPPAN